MIMTLEKARANSSTAALRSLTNPDREGIDLETLRFRAEKFERRKELKSKFRGERDAVSAVSWQIANLIRDMAKRVAALIS